VPLTPRPPFAVVLSLTLALASAAPARADDDRSEKNACASASEEAQRLQGSGKLLAARQKFLECTRTSCPSVVKQDCDGMLTTLETQIPSLVIAVRDEEGRDVVGVVRLDGAIVDASSGRAVPLDPGMHALHVEAPGKLPIDQSIVVHEGERARPVAVTLASKDPKRATRSPGTSAPPGAPGPYGPYGTAPSTSPFVYILGTLAGVALASFTALELIAVSDATHLRNTCAPRCPQSDVDRVSTEAVGADVSIVLAGVFAGGAVAAWFFGRNTSPAARAWLAPPRGGLTLTF
jgi:hypothetical protein